MTTYARITNGAAHDIFVVPAGLTIGQMLHADVVALFVEVPDGTLDGYVQTNGVWGPPAATESTAPFYSQLTPMQFYLAFTPAERIAIKSSTDAHVVEFLATMNMSTQLQENIDPNLVSVQEAINYLATPTTANPAGPGILEAERVTQILQGIPQ